MDNATTRTDANQCCCGPNGCAPVEPHAAAATVPSPGNAESHDALRGQVREGYARIAQTGSWSALQDPGQGGSCCAPGGGCCGPATFTPEQLANAIGYTQSDLAITPEGANMGLSCGNPTALASLRPGGLYVILDHQAADGAGISVAGTLHRIEAAELDSTAAIITLTLSTTA